MTREDILAFLRTHKQEMQMNQGIEVMGLFGSYAQQAVRFMGSHFFSRFQGKMQKVCA